MNKNILKISVSLTVILAMVFILCCFYANSNRYLINKSIKYCNNKYQNSPEYCECIVYTDFSYFKNNFKDFTSNKWYRNASRNLLSKEDKEKYYDLTSVCNHFLADEDFFNDLGEYKDDIYAQNYGKCGKELLQQMSDYDKVVFKMDYDLQKSSLYKKYSEKLDECALNYQTDEEYKKHLLFRNNINTSAQKECINNLTHDEIALLKKGDFKTKSRLDNCVNENADINELIEAIAETAYFSKDNNSYREAMIRGVKVTNCLENALAGLSQEELLNFKHNYKEHEITLNCLK